MFKKREYVKGRNFFKKTNEKGKPNQRESSKKTYIQKGQKKRNKGKTEIKEREQKKGECSKTHRNKKKEETFLEKNKTERKDKHARTNKAVKVPNTRAKRQTMQKFQTLVSKGGHRQRKQKKED